MNSAQINVALYEMIDLSACIEYQNYQPNHLTQTRLYFKCHFEYFLFENFN